MSTSREWTTIKEYEEILFDYYNGIARITINRERYRNAFTPTTTGEMSDALRICREEADIWVVVITGAGDKAFCSGGDQNVKGRGGYIGKDGVPRLSVLDVQKQIRSIPKPVIAAVNGYAIGGGHVLHVVCDLSIASENAIFGQTGPRVGSFDAGFGADHLFLAGTLGAVIVTWFTFLFSFVFILAGAPIIESTHNELKFTAPLTAITAAVVGVILNLALFFSYHVLWPQGFDHAFNYEAAIVTIAAMIALFKFQINVLYVIFASALFGLVLYLFV
jgi:hypothetical protein